MIAPLRVERLAAGHPAGLPAVSEVSFEVMAGEVVALVGANGSGKTTLLRTIAGLCPALAGRVFLAGEEAPRGAAARARRGVALTFQNADDQLFGATVGEDVAVGPRHQGLKAAEVSRRVGEALAATGISALENRPIDALSFGEKKRACLAGVLAMRPSVLLLDEPTAGLDPLGERAALMLIRRLSREHRWAALVATHAVEEVPLFADRIAVLGGGGLLSIAQVAPSYADAALWARAGLRPCAIAELWRALPPRPGAEPLPLTVPEAAARLSSWLGARGHEEEAA